MKIINKMDHIVYLDAKSNELEKLLDGTKTMIIRGATGRKMPYGRVNKGDKLFFIKNNAEGLIKANADVYHVFNSDKLTPEKSIELVNKNKKKLNLTETQFKKWAGKRYLVFIELKNIKEIKPLKIDKTNYGNMDDWIPVEDIKNILKN